MRHKLVQKHGAIRRVAFDGLADVQEILVKKAGTQSPDEFSASLGQGGYLRTIEVYPAIEGHEKLNGLYAAVSRG